VTAQVLQGIDAAVPVLAARIAEEARQGRGPAPLLVCIDGWSGAGKTALGEALAGKVGCAIVHMDDLYGGWDGLERAWPRLAAWVVEPLRAGRTATWRAFDWAAGQFTGPKLRVAPGQIVIAEGCGSAPRAADGVAHLIVWVEAPAAIRWRRALARDGEAAAPLLRAWAADEAVHHAREGTRERADVIVGTGG
jgi:uridine kinase